MKPERARLTKDGKSGKGPLIYWMSRDQRVDDNWALIFSKNVAEGENRSLIVVFCLANTFLDATIRQYSFMIDGLKELEQRLDELNIPFILLSGDPAIEISELVKTIDASKIITDFDPLNIKRKWKADLAKKIKIPFYEVDARNIVPCWAASNKREFGAYTIRPKIHKILGEYLDEYPVIRSQRVRFNKKGLGINIDKALSVINVDKTVKPVTWIKSGEIEANKILKNFIKFKLDNYPKDKNDPSKDALSNLSPYLHFGQISSQTIYREVANSAASKTSKTSFLEELVVRRELSDNYCYYTKDYDKLDALPNWSIQTLKKHSKDKRQHLYSLKRLENAETDDIFWNTAQKEMLKSGKMHGYARMYWAKKILEWTKSPEVAIKTAIYLNDRYELDGRDTNGYAGIMWSIGGLHDRAWGERKIFGKIRYMSFNSQSKKFDLDSYVEKIERIK